MERLVLPSLGLFKRLASHGQRLAIVSPTATVTYRDLLVASSRLSRRLAGPSPSSSSSSSTSPPAFRPIALIAPRDHSYCVGQLAIFQAGGAYVPLHTKLPLAETRYLLQDSGCRHAVVHPCFRPALEQELRALGVEIVDLPPGVAGAAAAAPTEVGFVEGGGAPGASTDAMVIYTSGTTGRPKGVVKTHAELEAIIASLVEAWEYRETDRILHLLPLHHLHGVINKLLCVLHAGGTVEFPEEGQTKAADVLRRLARSAEEGGEAAARLTLFHAVPTIYASLMEELESGRLDASTKAAALEGFRCFRLMVSGSAALPQTLFHKWESRTGHRLLERYGTTESGFILSNPLRGGPRLPGYVGQPLPGVEVRLVDPATEEEVGPGVEGEVRVKSPQVFRRYHERPEATREAFDAEGWYKTGDLAVADPEKGGSYRVLGRLSSDILKSGGYKISALDIEAAILEALPQVAEAAVVGRPHPKWGDEIVAVCRVVAPREGEGEAPLTLATLQATLAPRLAPYKLPRDLVVVDALPKNAMGKVNKRTLLQELGAASRAPQ